MNKRYYWIKLQATFFDDLKIKKMRKITGGDTFVCIYLKLMLLSLKCDGIIEFESVYDTIEAELADKLGEKTENVKATLVFASSMNMVEIRANNSLLFSQVEEMTGSESASATRMRKHRALENKKQKQMSQCDKNVTTEKEKELEYIKIDDSYYYEDTEKLEEFNKILLKKQIKKDIKKEKLNNLSQANRENQVIEPPT